MEIFALKGKGNSGKTTTIRLLRGLFLQNGYIVHSDYDPNGGDFRTIFSKNEKLIGITSAGDSFDLVHENLKVFSEYRCAICVCACRTFDRGGHGTHAAIDVFIPPYKKNFIDKTIGDSFSSIQNANQNDAQILFQIVDALV